MGEKWIIAKNEAVLSVHSWKFLVSEKANASLTFTCYDAVMCCTWWNWS